MQGIFSLATPLAGNFWKFWKGLVLWTCVCLTHCSCPGQHFCSFFHSMSRFQKKKKRKAQNIKMTQTGSVHIKYSLSEYSHIHTDSHIHTPEFSVLEWHTMCLVQKLEILSFTGIILTAEIDAQQHAKSNLENTCPSSHSRAVKHQALDLCLLLVWPWFLLGAESVYRWC